MSLYRIFLRLGYHVLALDYRGFGDSSPVSLSGLTEDSVVADARAGLEWVTSKLGDKERIDCSCINSLYCPHLHYDGKVNL